VENEANDSQEQIPREGPNAVDYTGGAGENWPVACPKWTRKNDEGYTNRNCDGHDGTSISDVRLIPFVTNDGQVAIQCGQRHADQQDRIVDRIKKNYEPTDQVIASEHCHQLECHID
jgi:hypothetical protein